MRPIPNDGSMTEGVKALQATMNLQADAARALGCTDAWSSAKVGEAQHCTRLILLLHCYQVCVVMQHAMLRVMEDHV